LNYLLVSFLKAVFVYNYSKSRLMWLVIKFRITNWISSWLIWSH
jgi:hypothetical protein